MTVQLDTASQEYLSHMHIPNSKVKLSINVMWHHVMQNHPRVCLHYVTCDNNYQRSLGCRVMSQDTILKQVLTCFGIQGVTLGIVPQSEFLQSGLHHLHCETRLQVHMHACVLKTCCKRTCFDPLVGRWYSLNCFLSCLSFMILKHIFGSRGSWRFELRKRD